MKSLISYKVWRINVDDEYYVEITPYIDNHEKWLDFTLCKENYGIKSFMFGLSRKHCPESEWKEIIFANVDDYIASFEEEIEILESALEKELFSDNQGVDGSLAEAIEMHNNHVNKMQDLAQALMDTYPDVENTPVDTAFCEAFSSLIGNAIYLCCEANGVDECKWMTTEDWHVMRDE
jgi:hypothetical protein